MLKKLITARQTTFIFVFVGIIWYCITHFLANNDWRNAITIGFTFIFGGVFVWSLFNTLRRIYGNQGHLYKELGITLLNVIIFLLTFSAIYSEIGIVNTTVEGKPITYDFWLCVYYSIITFTSTGYGDFQPHGIGRVLASVHAIVGYLVLGIMASTSLSVIQWTAEGSGFTRGIDKEENDLNQNDLDLD